MLDAPEELLRSIRLGEGAHLELKEVVFAGERVKGPGREQLADELAAFANAHGGRECVDAETCVLGSRTGESGDD